MAKYKCCGGPIDGCEINSVSYHNLGYTTTLTVEGITYLYEYRNDGKMHYAGVREKQVPSIPKVVHEVMEDYLL